MNNKIEEYYEKLSAILRTMDSDNIDDNDRAALNWVALDYLELLGTAIGTEQRK